MGASSVTNSTATYVEAVGPYDVMWADNPQLGIGIFNQGKSVKTEYGSTSLIALQTDSAWKAA